MVETELNLNFAWDTYAPPDFLIYVYSNYSDKVAQRWMESSHWNNIKINYKKKGKIHFVSAYGLKTETEFVEVSKLYSNHYFAKTYASAKLLFVEVGGFIHTNYVSDGMQTTVRVSGSKVFNGLLALIIKLFKKKIERFASKIYADVPIEDDIIGQMWTDLEIAKSIFPEQIVKRIEARESFDDLIEFDKYHDSKEIDTLKFIEENNGVLKAGSFALHLKISISEAKEKLNEFIKSGECDFDENYNVYIFPDFHIKDKDTSIAKPTNQIEKSIIGNVSVGLSSDSKDIDRKPIRKIGKHDVFISYSSDDKTVADATCAYLESNGIRCWIASRDIIPGMNYQEGIINAINETHIMVLVFSSKSDKSPYIIREITEAVDNGTIVIPFRIENVLPSKSMKFLLNVPHWLDAMTPPLEQHLEKLAETILQFLNNEAGEDET
ncbi:MAG: toll/interleukin-1 receptor domain-containing protein [Deltaproteobacteria bacterium]|nr:toll/interleukin-1 receptor domain-containing protein [Deltaproteobacteria bacterium]